MLNSLLDYWKSLTTFGTVSLPLVGLFFLSTKSISRTTPYGYYTRLKLFIKRNGQLAQASVATSEGAGVAGASDRYQITQVSSSSSTTSGSESPDLIAEYPITSLDKESWWKFCLPSKSKLKKNEQTQTTSAPATNGEDCELKYFKKESQEIDYLLRLGLKFLKLQHQINLFLFYDSKKQNPPLVKDLDDSSGWKNQFQKKCEVKEKSNGESVLKEFFISTNPVSPNCLLVPTQVSLTLTTGSETAQVQADNGSSAEIKLEEIKKGSIEGNIDYSFADYYGKLQEFSWQNGQMVHGTNGQQTNQNPVLISLKPTTDKKFEFKLESASDSSSGSSGQNSLEI